MAGKGKEGQTSLMDLFDNQIKEIHQLLAGYPIKELPLDAPLLEDVRNNNMVFASDAAFELGGENRQSLSFELVTSNPSLVSKDAILLAGNDLCEITEDCDFARITLLNIQDIPLDGETLYHYLETVKFVKYHVNPKGYMLRTAVKDKEKVRVSKETAKESFASIGSAYVSAYKKLPYINHVTVLFVTGNSPIYEKLHSISEKKNKIVNTIDHILKGVLVNDCSHCPAKPLCDEVEGLRDIHKHSSNA